LVSDLTGSVIVGPVVVAGAAAGAASVLVGSGALAGVAAAAAVGPPVAVAVAGFLFFLPKMALNFAFRLSNAAGAGLLS
jgi:phosphate/sulfate permease